MYPCLNLNGVYLLNRVLVLFLHREFPEGLYYRRLLPKCPNFISETFCQLIIRKGKGLPITRKVGTGGRRGTILVILNLGAIRG